MKGKLAVAIIWHMHQPYYKHPQTSEFVLPWVRLHASKDYLHMARLLNEFPGVKVNFTMVPSLRDQLEDYARGADDEDTRVTMRTVEGTLSPEERAVFLWIHLAAPLRESGTGRTAPPRASLRCESVFGVNRQ